MNTLSGSLFIFLLILPLGLFYWLWNSFWKHYAPSESPPPNPQKKAGLITWLIFKCMFILFVAAVFIPATGMVFMVEGAGILVFGWINFLNEKFAHITPNWGETVMALTSLILLVYGGHWFLRWLYSNWGQRQASNPPRFWPMRWTLSLTALWVLFFSASIGFIGATHQTAWLIGGNKPLVQNSWVEPYNKEAESNLHQIYMACKAYWTDHGSENSCTQQFYKSTSYGYTQSAEVVVQAGGDEINFYGIAAHINGNSWYWINPKGKISELEVPELNTKK